MLNSLYKLK